MSQPLQRWETDQETTTPAVLPLRHSGPILFFPQSHPIGPSGVEFPAIYTMQWEIGPRTIAHVRREGLKPNSDGFSYQSLGVRLVTSTYSPHMQASPPITSSFCSGLPVKRDTCSNDKGSEYGVACSLCPRPQRRVCYSIQLQSLANQLKL